MAAPFSIDMLKGACLSHSLPVDDGDTAEDLTQRLGLHLVTKLLKPDVQKKRKATSAPSRSASAWYAFMRSEKPNVVAAGFTTRAEQIKEIARRYKIAKTVGTSSAPLALMPPSDSDADTSSPLALMPPSESDADEATDGLVQALKELDAAELNAAMAAHGLPVGGSDEEKIAALADAMMA